MLPVIEYSLLRSWNLQPLYNYNFVTSPSLAADRLSGLDVCRFSLIRNTSLAGFDPSLFGIVYSLFFVPLFHFSHSCLQGPLSFIHSEIRVYSQRSRTANQTGNVVCTGLKKIEILHAQGLNQFSYIPFYLLSFYTANARYFLDDNKVILNLNKM